MLTSLSWGDMQPITFWRKTVRGQAGIYAQKLSVENFSAFVAFDTLRVQQCESSYFFLACVASVSARVRRERWDESKKKGMTGEGEGREGKACPQTPFPHPSPLPLPILLPIPSFFAPVPTFALYLDWKRLLRRLIFSWFS